MLGIGESGYTGDRGVSVTKDTRDIVVIDEPRDPCNPSLWLLPSYTYTMNRYLTV